MTRDEWNSIKVGDLVQRNAYLPTQRCPEGHTSKVLQVLADRRIVICDKDGRELRTNHNHYWTRIPSKEDPMNPDVYPVKPIKPMPGAIEGQRLTADELEQAAREARADEEARAAKEKIEARINRDETLAMATVALLRQINYLLVDGGECSALHNLAEFRKELQPLAETYGVRIVLIGDKSTATLVTI